MSFEAAWKHTSESEGGYVWNKSDSGGETYRGVTRKSHPAWAGWTKVDEAKSIIGNKPREISKYLASDSELAAMVELLYRTKYWDPLGELPDLVKMKVFDMAVNAGQGAAVRILQTALNKLGAKLIVDGKLGPATRGAAQAMSQPEAIEKYCACQADYYRELAEKSPKNKIFLEGWLIRAKWRPTAG